MIGFDKEEARTIGSAGRYKERQARFRPQDRKILVVSRATTSTARGGAFPPAVIRSGSRWGRPSCTPPKPIDSNDPRAKRVDPTIAMTGNCTRAAITTT